MSSTKKFLTEPEFCVGMFLRPFVFVNDAKNKWSVRTITRVFGRGPFLMYLPSAEFLKKRNASVDLGDLELPGNRKKAVHTDQERYLVINVDRDWSKQYTLLQLLNQEGILSVVMRKKNQSYDEMCEVIVHQNRIMFRPTDSLDASKSDLNETVIVTFDNPDYIAQYASKNKEIVVDIEADWKVRPNLREELSRYRIHPDYIYGFGDVVKKRWR